MLSNRQMWTSIRMLAVLAPAILAGGEAFAGFAYAVSSNQVSRVTITGAGIDPLEPTSTLSNTAFYLGAGAPVTKTGTTNADQAKAGDGGFPPDDSTNDAGKSGQYARGDSFFDSLGAPPVALLGADQVAFNIAEAYRTTPGRASAIAISEIQVHIGDVVSELVFSFRSNPHMHVEISDHGNLARADLTFSVELYIKEDDGGEAPYLDWVPKGTANIIDSVTVHQGTVSGRTEPFSLNHRIDVPTPLSETYDPFPGDFTLTYTPPEGVEDLYARIRWIEAVEIEVPEPSGILVVVAGWTALSFARRRLRVA